MRVRFPSPVPFNVGRLHCYPVAAALLFARTHVRDPHVLGNSAVIPLSVKLSYNIPISLLHSPSSRALPKQRRPRSLHVRYSPVLNTSVHVPPRTSRSLDTTSASLTICLSQKRKTNFLTLVDIDWKSREWLSKHISRCFEIGKLTTNF